MLRSDCLFDGIDLHANATRHGAVTRLGDDVEKHKLIADPAALATKCREWAAQPGLRRIVVSHGNVIASNAREILVTLADALA